ncbi:DUF4857 domain-containing protein [Photobacterium sp. OFAV2-7]|uniref:DUF4857 domain-containing protein n=1 Tax=Photobacterium sp. OFAV2-7 TaxID=2917748 RepID=UPI001EF5D28C|nr:DUF4857 domain-containing protein [Photobacterium sp. OFAV2-7]MCG7585342.1 DUF4857 domain-containing protein [Photobacterium sp. OFAV2-7]
MAICAIYQKEWFKLKWYSLVLSSAMLVVAGYFWLNLTGQFAAIEPESMMWYRFTHLGDKPYSWVLDGFVLVGAITAVCQFVPEVVGKRVRILAHLPIPLGQVIARHLLAGSLMVVFVNGLLAVLALTAFAGLYPVDIALVGFKDMLFGQLPALAIYLGLTACIVESHWRYKIGKAVIAALATVGLFREYHGISDLLWLLVIPGMILLVADSFLSIKTRRLTNVVCRVIVAALVVMLVIDLSARLRGELASSHDDYYVFYSPVLEQFVYQQNGSGHQFSYGTEQAELSKSEFEAALPFVYWKNLDIQGKLPVTLDGRSFDKRAIRNARMSLQYDPGKLLDPDVALYPLFNPISHKGAIPFPEQAFAVKVDSLVVYEAETAEPNRQLTDELNQQLLASGVTFPISKVWGKTTNMKPFDWGYFIKDSNNRIFNLRRADNVLQVEAVSVPASVGELAFMQVSENRHKLFYGYAIAASSQVYLISYPDYSLIPLPLEGFDYHKMSLQLLADPLYYLVRFDDGENYHAARFDKQYNLLDKITLHAQGSLH